MKNHLLRWVGSFLNKCVRKRTKIVEFAANTNPHEIQEHQCIQKKKYCLMWILGWLHISLKAILARHSHITKGCFKELSEPSSCPLPVELNHSLSTASTIDRCLINCFDLNVRPQATADPLKPNIIYDIGQIPSDLCIRAAEILTLWMRAI